MNKLGSLSNEKDIEFNSKESFKKLFRKKSFQKAKVLDLYLLDNDGNPIRPREKMSDGKGNNLLLDKILSEENKSDSVDIKSNSQSSDSEVVERDLDGASEDSHSSVHTFRDFKGKGQKIDEPSSSNSLDSKFDKIKYFEFKI